MLIRMIVIGLLLTASTAQAKVYRCVDPATGKTTFTDVACARNKASSDQVRVNPQNFGAGGHHTPAGSQQRVWRSQDPDRRETKADQNSKRKGSAASSSPRNAGTDQLH